MVEIRTTKVGAHWANAPVLNVTAVNPRVENTKVLLQRKLDNVYICALTQCVSLTWSDNTVHPPNMHVLQSCL